MVYRTAFEPAPRYTSKAQIFLTKIDRWCQGESCLNNDCWGSHDGLVCRASQIDARSGGRHALPVLGPALICCRLP